MDACQSRWHWQNLREVNMKVGRKTLERFMSYKHAEMANLGYEEMGLNKELTELRKMKRGKLRGKKGFLNF